MIPTFKYIFLECRPIARLGDGFVYNDNPMNYACPDCNGRLKVGIEIVDDKVATYYSHCYRCGFDLKLPRDLDEDNFDNTGNFDIWGFLDTI